MLEKGIITKLIKVILLTLGDEDREDFYEYTASLAKKHNIPRMSEKRLDNFLHDKE